jgi:hypothetical protein
MEENCHDSAQCPDRDADIVWVPAVDIVSVGLTIKTMTSTEQMSANKISTDPPEGEQKDQASHEARLDPKLEMVVMGRSEAESPRGELDGLKTGEKIAITPEAGS